MGALVCGCVYLLQWMCALTSETMTNSTPVRYDEFSAMSECVEIAQFVFSFAKICSTKIRFECNTSEIAVCDVSGFIESLERSTLGLAIALYCCPFRT